MSFLLNGRMCRACGCTDDEACILEVRRPPGKLPQNDMALRLRARAERAIPTVTCSWAEPDLCTRCALGAELRRKRNRTPEVVVARIRAFGGTRAQRREFARIRYRWPAAQVLGFDDVGHMIVGVGHIGDDHTALIDVPPVMA